MNTENTDNNGKKQMSNSTQTILVILLAVVMGVLFGMGSSFKLLLGGGKADVMLAGDISRDDVMKYAELAGQLVEVESPEGMQGWYVNYMRQMAASPERANETLLFAKLAEEEGLLPKGEALKKVVSDYVSSPATEKGKTRLEVLENWARTEKEISRSDLEWYLSKKSASESYSAKHLPSPFVSKQSGIVYSKLSSDKVKTDEVVISSSIYADKHKAAVLKDEELLKATYDELYMSTFVVPESWELSVASIEKSAIKNSVIVTDAEVSKYYNANKQKYLIPSKKEEPKKDDAKPADKPKEPKKPEYKKIADVKSEILDTLKDEKAAKLAEDVMVNLDNELRANGVGEEDAEKLTVVALEGIVGKVSLKTDALTSPIKLSFYKDVKTSKPEGKEPFVLRLVSGSELAKVDTAEIRLYDMEEGSVSLPLVATNDEVHLVIMMNKKIDSSFKELKDVKDEVVKVACAKLAYKDLLEESTKLIESVKKAGNLSVFFTDAETKKYKTKITNGSYAPLDEITTPKGEDEEGESVVIMSIAGKDKPILLVSETEANGYQRIKLLQVSKYEESKTVLEEDQKKRYASEYERAVSSYISAVFQKAIRDKIKDDE